MMMIWAISETLNLESIIRLNRKSGLNHQRVRGMDLEIGKRIREEKKVREDRRVFIGLS